MKTLHKTFLLISVFFSMQIFSQNQNVKWYFGGNAALDFMTNPPTVLNNSAMNTMEGSASISDLAGNLLFYTDGVTVWNKQHTVMANGTGLFGNGSTTQSAIIIKQPGNSNLYYIFTLDACGYTNGLNYSVVDMSLAAGLGSVTVLNAPLYNNPCVEKLHATKHANGTDYWVMIHGANNTLFRAYLLTSAGVNAAVVSSVGMVHSSAVSICCGAMKFSPNGQKIGCALGNNNLGSLELYDFDNSTGIVSNPLNLMTYIFHYAYGCEFSPDGTKFYAGGWNGSKLVQWDLSAGSNAAIISSSVTIDSLGFFGSMQLAPDMKIYVANTGFNSGATHLNVINNPNSVGYNCNYVHNGQAINAININTNQAAKSFYGLPNMIANPCFLSFSAPNNSVVCNSTDVVHANIINLSGNQGSVYYLWNNGSVTYTTSQVNNLSIGNWNVTLTDEAGCTKDNWFTVSQSTAILIVSASNINSCAGSPVTLNANGASSYTWSNGAQLSSIVVSPTITTLYSVSATDQYGCVLNNTITINPLPIPEISLNTSGDNHVSCAGDTLILSANGANSYAWSANGNVIANTQTLAVAPTNNTTYYVTGTAQNGCESLSIPVTVTVAPKPALSISGSTIYCSAQIVTLTASGAYNYYWQWGGAHDHASQSSIVLKQGVTTQYTLTGTSEYGCKSVEVVTVTIGCVGVDELKIENEELKIYPNPSSEILNVELKIKNGGTDIKIIDVLGNTVIQHLSFKIYNSIDVRGLKSGIYFVKVGNEVRKFVKE